MGRKFGWHSGTLTCQDAKVRGDLYVQDDIVFSDVSAGRLGVTGGISFSGNYTGSGFACIDFSSVTIDSTGSSGAVMIRAGTYGSPVTSSDSGQSGMMRLYGKNTATTDSEASGYYDRGIFVSLQNTGSKGMFPISALAEVRTESGDGPTSVMAGQFIVALHTSGAKLAATASTVDGMFGVWSKVFSIVGSVAAATSRVASIWLDSQLHGTTSGENYAAFITNGGLKADAVFAFETGNNAGWTNLFYFDETAFDQDPIGTADLTDGEAKEKYLKVDLNGTAYGIQLYTI